MHVQRSIASAATAAAYWPAEWRNKFDALQQDLSPPGAQSGYEFLDLVGDGAVARVQRTVGLRDRARPAGSSPPEALRKGVFIKGTVADAVANRLHGKRPGRARGVLVAGAIGFAAAVSAYRLLRT